MSSHETSSSSSFLSHKLGRLQDLHECVEKLFQLPLIQEALHHERQEKWVDELLNGSLRLLDGCTNAKDSLLHTKECMRELQSVMRRRNRTELKTYLAREQERAKGTEREQGTQNDSDRQSDGGRM
ncbi:hypothetical protein AAZX31_11G114400 [Glycine max]|uniref:Uncharacterized protein n=2 Tax=Glycine subgen. Soja TaxID=1462606 RepID=K7LP88_SOYBN|nr:hypothetical protein JHK86_030818 [Glycine max]KAH1158697.1 hypothetical protein GYH30_030756 [Glycine max]KHN39795.1 hypothetical protein glysoja_020535 [Glycine soja]KRH29432.1 hypothetical protein GLYMA_11G116300v4 [Glycine max]RZB79490.1 hypothetical protein D0Y65_029660 [Glycine soja]